MLKEEFRKTIEHLPGLAEALETGTPEVAIRWNRRKGARPQAGAESVPWCPQGQYLARRPNFTLDPAFHQGMYYVQDASSMAIDEVIRSLGLTAPVRYLDACAAPGGKTTAAIDALPDGSFVLANEYEPARARVLCENLMKWGYGDVVVSLGPAQKLEQLTPGSFDIVAADVPCSGEGMMRKDQKACEQWSPGLVKSCAALQREIVAALWPLLRPGGWFIYSTCTFNRVENEDNVDWMVRELGAELKPLPEMPGVVNGHFYPHLVRGEGLYISLLHKPGNEEAAPLLKLPPKILQRGVGELFQAKGREQIPTYAACHALSFRADDYPQAEVDRESALNYLRRESLRLESAPKGIVLLTYCGRPLGFVNNLGSRANNLLPKGLRILTQ